jgi:hypothetical protein
VWHAAAYTTQNYHGRLLDVVLVAVIRNAEGERYASVRTGRTHEFSSITCTLLAISVSPGQANSKKRQPNQMDSKHYTSYNGDRVPPRSPLAGESGPLLPMPLLGRLCERHVRVRVDRALLDVAARLLRARASAHAPHAARPPHSPSP